MNKSTDVANGRYSHGGTTDVLSNRLGWWERTNFKKLPMDIKMVVTKRYAGRPDLVAYDVYGRTTLMWVVLQYNTILDIAEDFVEGTQITLPTRSRLFSELLTGKASAVFA